MKFFGSRVIEKKSKKTDEKGRVRAGILSLLLEPNGMNDPQEIVSPHFEPHQL